MVGSYTPDHTLRDGTERRVVCDAITKVQTGETCGRGYTLRPATAERVVREYTCFRCTYVKFAASAYCRCPLWLRRMCPRIRGSRSVRPEQGCHSFSAYSGSGTCAPRCLAPHVCFAVCVAGVDARAAAAHACARAARPACHWRRGLHSVVQRAAHCSEVQQKPPARVGGTLLC